MMGFTLKDVVVLLIVIPLSTALYVQLVPHFEMLDKLYILFLLPLLLLFYVIVFHIKRKVLQRFAVSGALDRLIPVHVRRKEVMRAMLVILIVWIAILAYLRPQWGYRLEKIERKGVDIVLVVDVSASMLAQDVEPNRLERAKREIKDLLRRLEGDRVALVAFAGIPFVQCPLTLDYGAVGMFLDQLSPDLIPVPGTGIALSIEKALEVLKESPRESKAIILITDGEDHEGEPLQAAKKAKEQGANIYAIGVGKTVSAPIPMANGQFKTDRKGSMITTSLDETSLQKVALETGGSYVRSVTGDMDLEAIYDQDIRVNLEAQELSSNIRKRWQEGFQYFLGPAALLLLLLSML